MELDPTGKEVPWFFLFVFLVFFTTTFTTKLSKNRKMKKNFLLVVSKI